MPQVIETNQSPRFEDDVLTWYEYNTFSVVYRVRITNEDGDYITIDPTDRIVTRFYRRGRDFVHEFETTNMQFQEDDTSQFVRVELNFNQEISQKFTEGNYTFCMTYYGGEITTIAAEQEAKVEKCH